MEKINGIDHSRMEKMNDNHLEKWVEDYKGQGIKRVKGL